jgi:hypothetical protein
MREAISAGQFESWRRGFHQDRAQGAAGILEAFT